MKYKNIIEEIEDAIKRRILPNCPRWTICLDGSKIVCLPHNRIPFEVKPVQTFTRHRLIKRLSRAELLYLERQIVKALKETKK